MKEIAVPEYFINYVNQTSFQYIAGDNRISAELPLNEASYSVVRSGNAYDLGTSDRNGPLMVFMKNLSLEEALIMLLSIITRGIGTRNIVRFPSMCDEFPNKFAPGWSIISEHQGWLQFAHNGVTYAAKMRDYQAEFSYLADLALEQVVDSLQDFNAAPLFTQFLWARHAPTIEEGYFTPPDQWVWPPEGVQLLPHN